MNIPLLTSDTIFILLLSLQRICRNLSDILNALEVDVNSFRRVLTEFSSTIPESSSSSSNIDDDEENNNYEFEKKEDFYEQLFDEQLEPKPLRVTTL
ncbi:unnamed protein product [Rotaria sordida]|uniref:Uncharacterized protein n=1 Tax=Rotaria sordida TaxID=392033 RepID=A0A814XSD1_9BILA|nr:unnamed protein product [Rotaria sordida]CAF1069052.1 unnamed protein product [Rotaria sordida]CAF1219738.1 unnamed protein product [Rotaria sordida]CAF3582012.1 unnamed protein product [Rotaria sordida]CAF3682991.1 unnamed protein product [Rotaria sordida]